MQCVCGVRVWWLLVFNCTTTVGNKRPATEHAAVWVPDSEAQTCMHCLKTKFTPINRRVSHLFTIPSITSYCSVIWEWWMDGGVDKWVVDWGRIEFYEIIVFIVCYNYLFVVW